MARRSWLEYNPDRIKRPTVAKRRKVLREGARKNVYGNWWDNPYELEKYEQPQISPYEILDILTERFNKAPLSYKTDPATGKVTATRSMPSPEMPSEIAGRGYPFEKYFGQKKPLTTSWVLPEGALTGPRFIQRTPPQSDYQRQMAHRWGVSGTGTTTATLNPQTHWPSSAFKTPMREAGKEGGYPEPVFGSTIDYTTGKRYSPTGAGTTTRLTSPYSWTTTRRFAEPYGRFDPRRKTPPTWKAWGKYPYNVSY